MRYTCLNWDIPMDLLPGRNTGFSFGLFVWLWLFSVTSSQKLLHYRLHINPSFISFQLLYAPVLFIKKIVKVITNLLFYFVVLMETPVQKGIKEFHRVIKNRCLQLVQHFKKKLLFTSVLVIILSPFLSPPQIYTRRISREKS